MKALRFLAFKQLVHHPARNVLVMGCLALVVFLPLLGGGLLRRYDHDLHQRANATPLVLGKPGNRFDLCLGALFFRQTHLAPLTMGDLEPWSARQDLVAVPISLGATVQGQPLVGTTPEYFERRGLGFAQGRLPLKPGEIVLGARVAKSLGAELGARLRSDPPMGFGLVGNATQVLVVTGILQTTHGPDDRAVFGALQTCWLLDGWLHGHADAQSIAQDHPEQVLAKAENGVLLSGALVPDQDVAQVATERLHLHADPASLPISAILLWPASDKVLTIVQADTNAQGLLSALRPTQVVDDLLALTLRIKSLIDRLIWLLGLGMALLFLVVCVLSAQLRAGELRTLARMGARPGFATGLLATEV
ncbi:MAG TPA: ABC transporter permease, partial [Planctomycetota bacterium]|nr:ABC transporter permease [Planctomycetota bacterium]